MSFVKNCRKVVCVGRNYAAHAKELNNAIPSAPILFLKPPSSFLTQGSGPIEVPIGCTNLHYEVELGIVIGRGGRDIAKKDAMKHVKGYFLGIDMTARELQDEAKKKGLPWSIAKGLDTFAPTSDLIDAADIPDVSNVELWLSVNGKDRQRGNTSDMLFDVPTIISYISERFRLEEGDCIFTGTPEGVGAVVAGDVIKAGLIEKTNGKELAAIKFDVAPRPAAKL